MKQQIDTVTIDGIEFEHATNDRYEYYAHRDDKYCWQIYRKIEGDEKEIWFAVVSELKPDGLVQSLNSITRMNGNTYIEPLSYINDRFYKELLVGLVGLIKKGEFPYVEVEYDPPEDGGIAIDFSAPATV